MIDIILGCVLAGAVWTYFIEYRKVNKLENELYRLKAEAWMRQHTLTPKRGRGRPRKNPVNN